MDALKKAEQEKREAARKQEDSGSASLLESGTAAAGTPDTTDQHPVSADQDAARARPFELSLEPVSGEFATTSADAGSTPEAPHSFSGSEEPTLNVTGEQLLSMQLNTSQPMAAPVTPSPSGLAAELVPGEGFDGDQTFHGFDVNASPPAVPGMFEETVRGDVSATFEARGYDETLPGVSAAQLTKDIGTRDQPTPVAAETVFIAGSYREGSGSGIKWVLGGLTVVMLVAAWIWYYFTVTPVARNVPSPWVARGIESVPASRGEAGLAIPGGAEIPGAVPVPEAVPVAPADAGVVSAPAAETSVPAAESAPVVPATPEAVASQQPATHVPESMPTPVPAEPAPETVPAAATPAAVVATAPSLVRISRQTEPGTGERMVREAYTLYQSGDLAGAQSIYLAVLNESPDNIDALLGYGAIALRQGKTARAVEAHGHVLRLDPDNDTALAVLVGLNKSTDLNGAESALNSLIQDNPEQPFLYFTLGNIYAAQQRWPEAQQAFFDAHRTDSSNPDYALNLAISLDRMGQQPAALDYYNTALQLAEQHPGGFDPSAILARIQSLSSGAAP